MWRKRQGEVDAPARHGALDPRLDIVADRHERVVDVERATVAGHARLHRRAVKAVPAHRSGSARREEDLDGAGMAPTRRGRTTEVPGAAPSRASGAAARVKTAPTPSVAWRRAAVGNAPRGNAREERPGRHASVLRRGVVCALARLGSSSPLQLSRALYKGNGPARTARRRPPDGQGDAGYHSSPLLCCFRRSFSGDEGSPRDRPPTRPSAAAGVRTGPTSRRPRRPCSGPREPSAASMTSRGWSISSAVQSRNDERKPCATVAHAAASDHPLAQPDPVLALRVDPHSRNGHK